MHYLILVPVWTLDHSDPKIHLKGHGLHWVWQNNAKKIQCHWLVWLCLVLLVLLVAVTEVPGEVL